MVNNTNNKKKATEQNLKKIKNIKTTNCLPMENPQIRLTGDKIEFFSSGTNENADVSLSLPAGEIESTYTLRLPVSLPASDTMALTVGTDGTMGFSDLGENTLSGEFNSGEQGAPGITSGEDTLSTTAVKLDAWIFSNLVDAPPRPANLCLASNNTTSVTVCWDLPTIYQLGILDRTVPFITGLNVKVYKNDDAGPTSLLGASGTQVETAAESRTVTGSATSFDTTVSAGDSVTVQRTLSGTCSVSEGATTVSGSGTLFLSELAQGVDVVVSGQKRTVLSVTSDTSATVGRAWAADATDATSCAASETRVVASVDSATALTVTEAYKTASTDTAPTFRSYESDPSITADPLTSTVSHLPREDSDNTALSAVRVHLSGSGSSGALGGTVTYAGESKRIFDYSTYDIGKSAANTNLLKIQVFYTNHNSALEHKIATIADVEFLTPGPPSAPTNLAGSAAAATSFIVSWDAPDDNDTNTAGNQSEPAIDNYRVAYESDSLAAGVSRFGGVQSHGSQTVTTPSLSTSLASLKPGQTYGVDVDAANTINASYGAQDTVTFDTTLPAEPSDMGSRSLSRSVGQYGVGARLLGNLSALAHDVLKEDAFPGGGYIAYSALDNVAINETNGSLTGDVHRFVTRFDSTDDVQQTEFAAFASPFPHASSEVSTGPHTRLTVTGQTDHHGEGDQSGFWSSANVTLEVATASASAQTGAYLVELKKDTDGETDHTISDQFFVDDLTATASIHSAFAEITADTNARYVSGVPTRGDGFEAELDVRVSNLGRHFVRSDKLIVATLSDGSNTFATTTVSNTTDFEYSTGESANTAPLDPSKQVRVQNVSVTYSDPSSGIHTHDANSYVTFRVQAFNLMNNSTSSSFHSINTAENQLDSASKKVYVDTISARYLASHYDKSSETSGGSRIHYPALVLVEGDDAVPDVSDAESHGDYDHTQNIASVPAYEDSLQFVSGGFRAKGDSLAYADYASTFLDRSGSDPMPDYSSVTGTGYRYATFKYDLSSGSASTISFIDITFHDYTLPSQADGMVDDLDLTVKLIDGSEYAPSTSNNSSIWLDGNSVLDTAVARSQANYSDSSNQPLAALQSTSSGNTNNTDTKRIVLVPGTSTSSLVVLVRVGLDMSNNSSLGHITVSCST